MKNMSKPIAHQSRTVLLTQDDATDKHALYATTPAETRGISILKSEDGQLYLVRADSAGFVRPYLISDESGPLKIGAPGEG